MANNPKPHELRDHSFRKRNGIERTLKPRPILPERHLFVSEGTKTEPNYLNGIIDKICQRIGDNARHQLVVIGDGNCTLHLLSKAEKYQRNDSDGFQHVWIIFDKDDFPQDAFDNTVSRCKALNKRYLNNRDLQFHAIWSNQCIELWFLLHYEYLLSDIPRENYREKLSKYIGRKYEKNDDHIFQTLSPNIERAIKNAKKLMEEYEDGTPPSQMAPSTNFYELIEALINYIT